MAVVSGGCPIGSIGLLVGKKVRVSKRSEITSRSLHTPMKAVVMVFLKEGMLT